jgi:hypothetical protein
MRIHIRSTNSIKEVVLTIRRHKRSRTTVSDNDEIKERKKAHLSVAVTAYDYHDNAFKNMEDINLEEKNEEEEGDSETDY